MLAAEDDVTTHAWLMLRRKLKLRTGRREARREDSYRPRLLLLLRPVSKTVPQAAVKRGAAWQLPLESARLTLLAR